MGFPVRVIVISEIWRLGAALATAPVFSRAAVRRPFKVDVPQDFCIAAVLTVSIGSFEEQEVVQGRAGPLSFKLSQVRASARAQGCQRPRISKDHQHQISNTSTIPSRPTLQLLVLSESTQESRQAATLLKYKFYPPQKALAAHHECRYDSRFPRRAER